MEQKDGQKTGSVTKVINLANEHENSCMRMWNQWIISGYIAICYLIEATVGSIQFQFHEVQWTLAQADDAKFGDDQNLRKHPLRGRGIDGILWF